MDIYHEVSIDWCRRCRGKPQVTPLGENLVVRFRRATYRTVKDTDPDPNRNQDHH